VKVALLVVHVLIALFGIASGVFKVIGGQADLDVFSHLGMGRAAIAVFGAVQAAAALATIPARSRTAGAVTLAGANLLASVGLFVAGVQPFGVLSLSFVAMALAVLARRPTSAP
jgi:hypothetical protein